MTIQLTSAQTRILTELMSAAQRCHERIEADIDLINRIQAEAWEMLNVDCGNYSRAIATLKTFLTDPARSLRAAFEAQSAQWQSSPDALELIQGIEALESYSPTIPHIDPPQQLSIPAITPLESLSALLTLLFGVSSVSR